MEISRRSIYFVCALLLVIQQQHHQVEAKAFLEFFYDSPKFQNVYHKHHRHPNHHVAPAHPEPVGGKERFKQICNVIRGISDCYA